MLYRFCILFQQYQMVSIISSKIIEIEVTNSKLICTLFSSNISMNVLIYYIVIISITFTYKF